MDKVQVDLRGLKIKVGYEIDAKHAEIFGVHQLILRDVELYKEIEKRLKNRLVNAEQIVQNVFRDWEKKLRNADTNIFQERANDVADVGRRVLNALAGTSGTNLSNIPADSVIFAQRLLPSDTASLNIKNAKAIVTVEGAQNSHSAILARALDIPFVSKIDISIGTLPSKTQVIVDGQQGNVIINPTPTELKSYPRLIQKRLDHKVRIVQQIKDFPLEMAGKKIRVYANVSSFSELKMAKELGADGVGLYRTEALYMNHLNLPTEEHLYNQLVKALALLPEQEITLRLLDLGGDKTLPFLNLVEIKDPALGLNGIRLLLKYPRLLTMQLRIFLRLSHKFNVKILVPLVSLPRDMTEVLRYLSQEKEKMRQENILFNPNLPVGAMIETPSALMMAEEILDSSHFLSFGTNDLVQYIMAAGREKVAVADYYEAGNHLILKALKPLIQQTEARGKECCLCGELAGNLKFTQELLGIGLRNFSVQPALIPNVKNKIRHLLTAEQPLS